MKKVDRQTVRTGCTTEKYRDRLYGQAVQQESTETDCADRPCNRKVDRQTVRTGCATVKQRDRLYGQAVQQESTDRQTVRTGCTTGK